MADEPTGDDRRMNLGDLVRLRQTEQGWSYQDIATRSGLSKAKVGQFARAAQPHMPRAETLRRLAVGLQLPLNVVQAAAMVSAGIDETGEGGVQQRVALVVAHLRDMPASDLELVEHLVGALVAHRAKYPLQPRG